MYATDFIESGVHPRLSLACHPVVLFRGLPLGYEHKHA